MSSCDPYFLLSARKSAKGKGNKWMRKDLCRDRQKDGEDFAGLYILLYLPLVNVVELDRERELNEKKSSTPKYSVGDRSFSWPEFLAFRSSCCRFVASL